MTADIVNSAAGIMRVGGGASPLPAWATSGMVTTERAYYEERGTIPDIGALYRIAADIRALVNTARHEMRWLSSAATIPNERPCTDRLTGLIVEQVAEELALTIHAVRVIEAYLEGAE